MAFHEKPATYVGNVQLKVEDLERSKRFYQTILGFDILEHTETTIDFTADGKTNILSIEQPQDIMPKQERTAGLYHFAILLPSKDDLAKFVVHLAQNDIPIGSSDHDVSEALYFNDLDGNGIEVYYDRDPSEWTWKGEEVHMTVDPLNFDNLLKNASIEDRWLGLPKETVMGHIHLHVSDLAKAEEFYTKGLGFEIVCKYGGQASFLSTAKYHHHVAINTWNGIGAPETPSNSVGLKSFTVNYPTDEARKEAIDRLEQMGAMISHENQETITKDPSGNQIVLAI